MEDIVKVIIGSIFTILGGVILTLFTIGVNKFINVCNMMLMHDFKIKDMANQVDGIDNKIDNLETSINIAVADLKAEINPIHKRVEKVELDIKKIKIHTKYDETRSYKVN